MNIIVLGGCGYIGSVLVNKLLKQKHKILVIDTQWFGNYLKPHKKLRIIKSDIRNLDKISFKGYETIIHLANIANDPSSELNPNLSWEVNVLATHEIITKAIREGIKKFIYSSSGSVYGIKKEKKVTENLAPFPLSIYNKTKMIAERVLLSFSDKIKIYIIRPGTVCGVSSRMRLDISINMLTMQAIKDGAITIFGGTQKRPNIHIEDLTNIFIFFTKKNKQPGIYNAGFENLSILNIAKVIKKKINCKINIKKIFDLRSYNLDSSKLIKAGFKPKYSIKNAINQIDQAFKEKKLSNQNQWHSVKWLKKIKII
jgi:nucleoside-diphosphate-sugar epimerase